MTPAFNLDPNTAARHEGAIAKAMHEELGLNGKLPPSTSEQVRVRVLRAIRAIGREATAEEVRAKTKNVPRSSVSGALSKLKMAGLVRSTRYGYWEAV